MCSEKGEGLFDFENEHEADMEGPPWANDCPLAGRTHNPCYGCERAACQQAKESWEAKQLFELDDA